MTKLSFEQKVKIREDFGMPNPNPFDIGLENEDWISKAEKSMKELKGEVEFVLKKPMKVKDIAIKYNCSKITIYNVLKYK